MRNLYRQLKAYLSWKSTKIKREENKERTDTFFLTARWDDTPVAGDESGSMVRVVIPSVSPPPAGTN